MVLNLNNCSQDCHNCIKAYKGKHDLRKGQSFQIKCEGIMREDVQLQLLSTMPEEEQFTALSVLDPVTWAAQNLDWHCLDADGSVWKRKNPKEYDDWINNNPGEDIFGHSRYHRPYQASILRCSARKKVFRIGRQAGKCLAPGTLIQMADGSHRAIEKINNGDFVLSMGEDGIFVKKEATKFSNGIKPLFRLQLSDGRYIDATENHKFLSKKRIRRQTWKEAREEGRSERRYGTYKEEWTQLKDLTRNDYIAVPTNIFIDDSNPIDNRYLSILGCMLADGNLTSENCRFSNESEEIVEHLRNALSIFECGLKQYESDDDDTTYHLVGAGKGNKSSVRDWFREIGLWGLNSHTKYIPDEFMRLPNENIVELLRCMFACDGWACVNKSGMSEIGYCTVSEKMAFQIVSLLARFGIYSDIRDKKTKLNGKTFWSKQICITRKKSIERFKIYIGILSKDDSVEKVYGVSQTKASSPKTEVYEEQNLTFIRVKEIIPLREDITWDLEVRDTHNFIANNILVHNSEVLVVAMLYHLFTKPGVPENEGFEIIVITPYQAQIDLIFSRIMELVRQSPLTQNSLKRNVKAPIYQIEFHNGSRIKGFTAGTKSGGNAEAVRGQHGHMLVFDEADYLSAGDMDAALSIITNYPTASLWMSSTPSGKRDKFYQTCCSPLFKEFYYPSQVNPLWDQEKEELFREQLTAIGYKHEILADFGEQEEGVFQNVYVQAAKRDYEYGTHAYNHTWTYTIGVDWNDVQNGTTLAVVGFNPLKNEFTLVAREIVSRDGWTQLSACEKVMELNRAWRPLAVYLDLGFGGTQFEILRKASFDASVDPARGALHPDGRLKDIMKQFDFGSTIEVSDLWTKQLVKKQAKPFLVETAVRRFEAGDFVFSRSDEELEKQLLGYVIDRVTAAGRPVYKAGDETAGDHLLDAIMLAIVAFTMEVTAFGQPKFDSKIAFAGNFGEKSTEIFPGDTVIHNRSKDSLKEISQHQKPDGGRTRTIEQQELFPSNLPASNLRASETKIWSWDGFNRDKPRSESNKGLSGRKGSKPRRKNI